MRYLMIVAAITLGLGCESPLPAPGEQPADAAPNPVAPPPVELPPLVSVVTIEEVSKLVKKWKEEFPTMDGLDQRSDETTQDYRIRMSQTTQAVKQFDQNWRYFTTGSSTAVSNNAGARFVREQNLSLRWECSVFDVRDWKNGGSEVLCSTASPEDWSFSAVGYVPRETPLKKGDLIQFIALNTSIPNEDEYWKPRMASLHGTTLRFKVLGAEEAANAVMKEATEAIKLSDFATAKTKLSALKAEYPSTKAGKAADQMYREVSLVGEPAAPLEVEKWMQGSATYADAPVTLLVFWEAWCPHCKREMPELAKREDDLKKKGVQIVGITKITKSATEESAAAFLTENDIKFPNAKEKDASMSTGFNVSGIPAAALVKGGMVIWRGHPGRLDDATIDKFIAD
jgi:peroxiredoxin